AFLVRIAAVMSALDLHHRASFWIGAVIADDVGHLIRHPILSGQGRVLVGGRQPQRSLYAGLLGEGYGGIVEELHDDLIERASASGALAVARRHRERFGR
ncbi:2-dehydro-3-deoxygalactonokinase, partial [Singulisphaera rosea]